MTLPSRRRIQNSRRGGLRPKMLPLGHRGSPQYWIFTSERGRNILFLWNLKARVGGRTRDHLLSKQAALTTAPGPRLDRRRHRIKLTPLEWRRLRVTSENWALGPAWWLPGASVINTTRSQQTRVIDSMLFNVGQLSTTLAQHWTSIGSTARVCWVAVSSRPTCSWQHVTPGVPAELASLVSIWCNVKANNSNLATVHLRIYCFLSLHGGLYLVCLNPCHIDLSLNFTEAFKRYDKIFLFYNSL